MEKKAREKKNYKKKKRNEIEISLWAARSCAALMNMRCIFISFIMLLLQENVLKNVIGLHCHSFGDN